MVREFPYIHPKRWCLVRISDHCQLAPSLGFWVYLVWRWKPLNHHFGSISFPTILSKPKLGCRLYFMGNPWINLPNRLSMDCLNPSFRHSTIEDKSEYMSCWLCGKFQKRISTPHVLGRKKSHVYIDQMFECGCWFKQFYQIHGELGSWGGSKLGGSTKNMNIFYSSS